MAPTSATQQSEATSSAPPIYSDVRISEGSVVVNGLAQRQERCRCGNNALNTDTLNVCLWLLLPLTAVGFVLQMIFALIIDVLAAMFWSASTLITICWNHYNKLCWHIFIVCVSPLLIIAGIFAMPCILGHIQNYRFLNQTRTQWFRALYMFPRQFHRCCSCCRI